MYQGVYTCSHCMDNKDKEDLVVSVSNTVVDPNTMVVLQIKDDWFNIILHRFGRFDVQLSKKNKCSVEHTILSTHLLQTRQW